MGMISRTAAIKAGLVAVYCPKCRMRCRNLTRAAAERWIEQHTKGYQSGSLYAFSKCYRARVEILETKSV